MRKPREIVPRHTYHVTARINRGEMLFAKDDYYKELLLEYIKKAKKKYSFSNKNLCIMDNHIHLQIKPRGDSQLANIMQSILGGFARKYNAINGLKGHVWYDRFKSKVIYSYQQFHNTYLYISNNPVRANMVDHPLEYAYNSLSYLYSNNCNEINHRLKDLMQSIIDPPGLKIQKAIREYLATFSKVTAQIPDESIGFYDKKPGRPKK